MTKPLRVTSPTNAWAIGALVMSFIVPVLAVTENYDPAALTSVHELLAIVWQWALLVTSAVALAATLTMQAAVGDVDRMKSILRVEAIPTAVVAVCYLLLGWSLIREYDWGTAPLTQELVLGLGATAAARVLQILWDLWRMRRASARGQTTNVEALADPRES